MISIFISIYLSISIFFIILSLYISRQYRVNINHLFVDFELICQCWYKRNNYAYAICVMCIDCVIYALRVLKCDWSDWMICFAQWSSTKHSNQCDAMQSTDHVYEAIMHSSSEKTTYIKIDRWRSNWIQKQSIKSKAVLSSL